MPLAQRIDIAALPVAKREIAADADRAGMQSIYEKLSDEGVRRK